VLTAAAYQLEGAAGAASSFYTNSKHFETSNHLDLRRTCVHGGDVPPRKSPSSGQLIHEFMWRTAHQGDNATLAMMHEAGLSLPQVVTLSMVREGKATINAIAKVLKLSLSATSSLVQRLVEQGLVSRTEDPDDRRQRHVALTRAGTDLIDRINTARAAAFTRGLNTLPPALRDDLVAVLTRCLTHLRGATP
jgi:DNA-binding MarR family transcriptional regulator